MGQPFAPGVWGIPVVASAIDRGILFATPLPNQRVQNLATGNVERWDGTQWVVDFIGGANVPVTDGATDLAASLQALLTAAPLGTTVTVPPSELPYVIGTGLTVPRTMTIVLDGATIQAKAGTSILDMLLVQDVDGVTIVGGTIDANNAARNGISGAAVTRNPDGLTIRNTRVINTAVDTTYNYAGMRVYSVDSGATKRFQNVSLENCRADTCGTLGASIAYVDSVTVRGWKAYTMRNHGLEFVGCTNVFGRDMRSKNCGGSGSAIGDHSSGFDISGVYDDGSTGDATYTIENTCAFGKFTNFHGKNCRKPLVNVSFGTAGTYPNDTIRTVEVARGTGRAIAPLSITSISQTNPCVVTVPSHGFNAATTSPFKVWFSGIAGMTQLNNTTAQITVLDGNRFSLQVVDVGTGIDATGFGAYTSGGTVGIFAQAVNMFATSPGLGQNVSIHDIDADGFNSGVQARYTQGLSVSDIRLTNMRGPQTFAGQFQLIQQSSVATITCHDSQFTHPSGAFQFQSLGSVDCTDVQIDGLYAFLCQQSDNTTYTPLIYWEGSGLTYVHKARTAGALNYISVRTNDLPTLKLADCDGPVTGAQIAGSYTAVQSSGNWSGANDFTVVGGRRRVGGTGIPISGDWSIGDRVENTGPAVASPKAWSVTVNGTLKAALVSITGSITSGTKLLTVSALSTLQVGNYISIVGVTGTKQIAAINTSTKVCTLDSTASATVSGAAVQYVTPTFVSEGNL